MYLKHITRPFDLKKIGDENGITGMGSVFGDLDSYRDIVLPGAFAKSIKEMKAADRVIPMLWQHRSDEPIGYWDSFKESEKGLELGGDFVLEVEKAREAQALSKRKVVTGLSIGYTVPKGGSEYDKEKNINFLSEIDLWEVSLVTFPAIDTAQPSPLNLTSTTLPFFTFKLISKTSPQLAFRSIAL